MNRFTLSSILIIGLAVLAFQQGISPKKPYCQLINQNQQNMNKTLYLTKGENYTMDPEEYFEGNNLAFIINDNVSQTDWVKVTYPAWDDIINDFTETIVGFDIFSDRYQFVEKQYWAQAYAWIDEAQGKLRIFKAFKNNSFSPLEISKTYKDFQFDTQYRGKLACFGIRMLGPDQSAINCYYAEGRENIWVLTSFQNSDDPKQVKDQNPEDSSITDRRIEVGDDLYVVGDIMNRLDTHASVEIYDIFPYPTEPQLRFVIDANALDVKSLKIVDFAAKDRKIVIIDDQFNAYLVKVNYDWTYQVKVAKLNIDPANNQLYDIDITTEKDATADYVQVYVALDGVMQVYEWIDETFILKTSKLFYMPKNNEVERVFAASLTETAVYTLRGHRVYMLSMSQDKNTNYQVAPMSADVLYWFDEFDSQLVTLEGRASFIYVISRPEITFSIKDDSKPDVVEITAISVIESQSMFCFSLFFDAKIVEKTDKAIYFIEQNNDDVELFKGETAFEYIDDRYSGSDVKVFADVVLGDTDVKLNFQKLDEIVFNPTIEMRGVEFFEFSSVQNINEKSNLLVQAQQELLMYQCFNDYDASESIYGKVVCDKLGASDVLERNQFVKLWAIDQANTFLEKEKVYIYTIKSEPTVLRIFRPSSGLSRQSVDLKEEILDARIFGQQAFLVLGNYTIQIRNLQDPSFQLEETIDAVLLRMTFFPQKIRFACINSEKYYDALFVTTNTSIIVLRRYRDNHAILKVLTPYGMPPNSDNFINCEQTKSSMVCIVADKDRQSGNDQILNYYIQDLANIDAIENMPLYSFDIDEDMVLTANFHSDTIFIRSKLKNGGLKKREVLRYNVKRHSRDSLIQRYEFDDDCKSEEDDPQISSFGTPDGMHMFYFACNSSLVGYQVYDRPGLYFTSGYKDSDNTDSKSAVKFELSIGSDVKEKSFDLFEISKRSHLKLDASKVKQIQKSLIISEKDEADDFYSFTLKPGYPVDGHVADYQITCPDCGLGGKIELEYPLRLHMQREFTTQQPILEMISFGKFIFQQTSTEIIISTDSLTVLGTHKFVKECKNLMTDILKEDDMTFHVICSAVNDDLYKEYYWGFGKVTQTSKSTIQIQYFEYVLPEITTFPVHTQILNDALIVSTGQENNFYFYTVRDNTLQKIFQLRGLDDVSSILKFSQFVALPLDGDNIAFYTITDNKYSPEQHQGYVLLMKISLFSNQPEVLAKTEIFDLIAIIREDTDVLVPDTLEFEQIIHIEYGGSPSYLSHYLLFVTRDSHTFEIQFDFEQGKNFPTDSELNGIYALYKKFSNYFPSRAETSTEFGNQFMVYYDSNAPGIPDIYLLFHRNQAQRQTIQKKRQQNAAKIELTYANSVRQSGTDQFDDLCDLVLFAVNDDEDAQEFNGLACYDNTVSGSLLRVWNISSQNITMSIRSPAQLNAQFINFQILGLEDEEKFRVFIDHINPQPSPDPPSPNTIQPLCKMSTGYQGISNSVFPYRKRIFLEEGEKFYMDPNDIFYGKNISYRRVQVNESDVPQTYVFYLEDPVEDRNSINAENFVSLKAFDMYFDHRNIDQSYGAGFDIFQRKLRFFEFGIYYQKGAPDYIQSTVFDLQDIEEEYNCFQIIAYSPYYFGIDCIFANYTNFWVNVRVDRDAKTPAQYIIEMDDVEEIAIYKRKMNYFNDIIIRAPTKQEEVAEDQHSRLEILSTRDQQWPDNMRPLQILDITKMTLGVDDLKIVAFSFQDNIIALANDQGKLWLIRINPENLTLIEPFTTFQFLPNFGDVMALDVSPVINNRENTVFIYAAFSNVIIQLVWENFGQEVIIYQEHGRELTFNHQDITYFQADVNSHYYVLGLDNKEVMFVPFENGRSDFTVHRGLYQNVIWYDQFTSYLTVFNGNLVTSYTIMTPDLVFDIDEQTRDQEFSIQAVSTAAGKVDYCPIVFFDLKKTQAGDTTIRDRNVESAVISTYKGASNMVLLDNYISGPGIDATIKRTEGSGKSDFLSIENANLEFADGFQARDIVYMDIPEVKESTTQILMIIQDSDFDIRFYYCAFNLDNKLICGLNQKIVESGIIVKSTCGLAQYENNNMICAYVTQFELSTIYIFNLETKQRNTYKALNFVKNLDFKIYLDTIYIVIPEINKIETYQISDQLVLKDTLDRYTFGFEAFYPSSILLLWDRNQGYGYIDSLIIICEGFVLAVGNFEGRFVWRNVITELPPMPDQTIDCQLSGKGFVCAFDHNGTYYIRKFVATEINSIKEISNIPQYNFELNDKLFITAGEYDSPSYFIYARNPEKPSTSFILHYNTDHHKRDSLYNVIPINDNCRLNQKPIIGFADPDILVYFGCDKVIRSWRSYEYKVATFESTTVDDNNDDDDSKFLVHFFNEIKTKSSDDVIIELLELSKRVKFTVDQSKFNDVKYIKTDEPNQVTLINPAVFVNGHTSDYTFTCDDDCKSKVQFRKPIHPELPMVQNKNDVDFYFPQSVIQLDTYTFMMSIINNNLVVLDNNWNFVQNYTLNMDYGFCDKVFKDLTNEINAEFFVICYNYSYSPTPANVYLIQMTYVQQQGSKKLDFQEQKFELSKLRGATIHKIDMVNEAIVALYDHNQIVVYQFDKEQLRPILPFNINTSSILLEAVYTNFVLAPHEPSQFIIYMAPQEEDYSGFGRDTVIDIIWADYDKQIFKEIVQEQNIIEEISDLMDLKVDPFCGIADIKLVDRQWNPSQQTHLIAIQTKRSHTFVLSFKYVNDGKDPTDVDEIELRQVLGLLDPVAFIPMKIHISPENDQFLVVERRDFDETDPKSIFCVYDNNELPMGSENIKNLKDGYNVDYSLGCVSESAIFESCFLLEDPDDYSVHLRCWDLLDESALVKTYTLRQGLSFSTRDTQSLIGKKADLTLQGFNDQSIKLQLAFGSKSEEESGLKAWAIILIVLGCIIFLSALVYFVRIYLKNKSKVEFAEDQEQGLLNKEEKVSLQKMAGGQKEQ